MTKLVSVLLAIMTALSGLGSAAAPLRSLGLQLGFLADDSAFLDKMTDQDVSQLSDSVGYVKNVLLVFFDGSAGLFDRMNAIRKADAAAVGCLPAAGLTVHRLVRVQEGSLRLGSLRRGAWRYLTEDELRTLKTM